MSAAAQNLTPVHFELGGKSANIIFDDADLDRAIDGSLVNIFSNSGQICIAGSRILVQRAVADVFIKQFVTRAKALKVGDPMDASTEVGPMTFVAHRDRVLSCIEKAKAEGAELLCGGSAVSGTTGYFVEPTVFRVDSNALSICQEEVFGPVVTIQVFDDEEQALEIANDSRFGLVGYCWTESLARAQGFQRAIYAGTLWNNTPLARALRAPSGGSKSPVLGVMDRGRQPNSLPKKRRRFQRLISRRFGAWVWEINRSPLRMLRSSVRKSAASVESQTTLDEFEGKMWYDG